MIMGHLKNSMALMTFHILQAELLESLRKISHLNIYIQDCIYFIYFIIDLHNTILYINL